jgi:hypothetical protein
MSVTKPISLVDKEKLKSIDKGRKDYVHKKESTSVLFRIPISILEKVDAKVKERPWTTRTQWIMEAIEVKLDEDS